MAFEPFAVRGLRQQKGTQASPGEAVLPFVGVTPAPAYMTRTWQEQRQRETGQKYRLSPLERRRRELGR